ncbi:MAG: hypothetical protein ACYCYK_11860 [Candidatus Dormibacteria bacterium]
MLEVIRILGASVLGLCVAAALLLWLGMTLVPLVGASALGVSRLGRRGGRRPATSWDGIFGPDLGRDAAIWKIWGPGEPEAASGTASRAKGTGNGSSAGAWPPGLQEE